MKAFAALLAAFVASAVSAFDLGDHVWQAPSATDVRGPCPGLNTLANHGFLPRDGRNMTVDRILQAGIDGFNIHPDVLILAAKIGVLTTTDANFFTLDDIKLHGTIEHDASVSRGDVASGDNVHFNETLFSALAESNPGVDFYNASSAGATQKRRLAESQASNPSNTNTAKEFAIRSQESALYLSIMGDPLTGVAPKEFVNVFFREERMPVEEGWSRPTTQITGRTMTSIRNIIFRTSEWSPNSASECSEVVFVFDTQGNLISF